MTDLMTSKKDKIDKLAESTGTSLAAQAFRRLRGNPVAVIGASIIFIFIVLAILSLIGGLAYRNPPPV